MQHPAEETASGADVEARSGTCELLEAMSNGQLHLARFILDALDGRLLDVGAGRGAHTPLAAAALLPEPAARARFLELLLERGAAVNARDAWGRTALSHACERGHLDAARRLVQAGADPELPDSWGNTALQYAAVAGHAPIAAFLVRAFKRLGGLDIHRANSAGNTALGLAQALGYEECVQALMGGRAGEEGGTTASKERSPGEVNAGSRAPPHRILFPRLLSMHSIEEEERGPGHPERLPSPRPPRTRSWSLQYGGSASRGSALPPLPGLPPLGLSCSPRAGKALPALPGHLSLLLTPLPPSFPRVGAQSQERFKASYFQKRSSLPSAACPLNHADASPGPSREQPGPLALLSNKLLRRFTFPEFRKPSPVLPAGSANPGQRGMARSETFPLSKEHPQAASKPSIDSVSGVKCEFDSPSQS